MKANVTSRLPFTNYLLNIPIKYKNKFRSRCRGWSCISCNSYVWSPAVSVWTDGKIVCCIYCVKMQNGLKLEGYKFVGISWISENRRIVWIFIFNKFLEKDIYFFSNIVPHPKNCFLTLCHTQGKFFLTLCHNQRKFF